MRVAQQDSLTTRRSFVYRGATLAGAVALSTGRASAVEAVGAPQASTAPRRCWCQYRGTILRRDEKIDASRR